MAIDFIRRVVGPNPNNRGFVIVTVGHRKFRSSSLNSRLVGQLVSSADEPER